MMSGLTEGVEYRWIGQDQLISVIKSLGLRDQPNVGNVGKGKYLTTISQFLTRVDTDIVTEMGNTGRIGL